ncbi:PREDICTED: filament-like plant protein 7 isoform X2 [Ipomoea nil]|uniref:filament-like plant protein 7 isoform X2 n=1 Tax=Ipomoea nil TaxID=35883 RepID=UPI000900C781|nr:PREDICTED: filament-like plant protein 7 isoform X2 [Ipomoea nil]
MDHKSWLWKKKPSEKNVVDGETRRLSFSRNEEEVHMLLNGKAELEREIKDLNDKLSSALSECNEKDDFAQRQANIAQEAIAGWEKAEAEAIFVKQELEKALYEIEAGDERLVNLDGALKECMQQLRSVRGEQEKRIHDAVFETSKEFEKTRIVLEEKLAEAGNRLAKLGAENTQLSKALLAKEKVIENLSAQRAQAEREFNSLMTRLDTLEKENASLKYEVRVIEKDLEIRNEEREFNRRTADASHKQHLESVKRIAKLESECQRLRLLVRKRLPGPAAMAKMKNEVEMLGRDQGETRRRKSNPSPFGSMDFTGDVAPDTPNKKIDLLTEKLCMMEEENRHLREALDRKAEGQFNKIPTNCLSVEAEKHLQSAQEHSVMSLSDMGSDDKASCAESWASALISELEHFKNEKQTGTPSYKNIGASDMNLMDDFVEMEKLAVEIVDNSTATRSSTLHKDCAVDGVQSQPSGHSVDAADREQAPVSDCLLEHSASTQNFHSEDVSNNHVSSLLEVLLEQSRTMQRNPNDILEDIKIALAHKSSSDLKFLGAKESSIYCDTLYPPPKVGEFVSLGSPDESRRGDSPHKATRDNLSAANKSNHEIQSHIGPSITKVIEIIEGVLPYRDSEAQTGFTVRHFQWKTSELSVILREFVQICHNLLDGNADFEKFAKQLTCTLEWIVNHCFSLQDVSSMKDAIKNHFDWDDLQSECELEPGMINHISEVKKVHVCGEPSPDLIVASCDHEGSAQVKEIPVVVNDGCRIYNNEFAQEETMKEDLERKLQSKTVETESLMIQLQESENIIKSLRLEVENLRDLKLMIEEQAEKDKFMKEDLEMELTETKLELNEACQKYSDLEKEMESRKSSSREPGSAHDELQFYEESISNKEIPQHDVDNEERILQHDRDITAASEKLAECQETILNLGKQLKALATPRDAALFDSVIPVTAYSSTDTVTNPNKNLGRRTSLLDKMIDEDNDSRGRKAPSTKELILNGNPHPASGVNNAIEHPEEVRSSNAADEDLVAVGSLAIVPSKKKNGGLLKKIFSRKKHCCKTTLP